MELQEIINTYVEKNERDPEAATLFMLGQFQEHDARILNDRYVGLFIAGNLEGMIAYDPITVTFYEIDPEYKAQDFEPDANEYILFKKKGKTVDGKLTHNSKLNYVQRLQKVGSEEILDAHIYDQKNVKEELFALYANLVSRSNEKKWAANKKNVL